MKSTFTGVSGAVILLLFFSTAASADPWTLCASSSAGGKLYFDKSSIKKVNKNVFRVSNKFEYVTPLNKQRAYAALKNIHKAPRHADLLSYDLSVNDINCANNTYRPVSASFHDVKGKTVYAMTETDKRWRRIVTGSFMDELRKTVCGQSQNQKPKKK